MGNDDHEAVRRQRERWAAQDRAEREQGGPRPRSWGGAEVPARVPRQPRGKRHRIPGWPIFGRKRRGGS